jgi:hypothetical protein
MQSHSISDLAIVDVWHEYNLSGAAGQLPERVRGTECSWNLFPTPGVEAAIGRTFVSNCRGRSKHLDVRARIETAFINFIVKLSVVGAVLAMLVSFDRRDQPGAAR